nr:putative neural-cadherin 2 [Procambarus clarkii]
MTGPGCSALHAYLPSLPPCGVDLLAVRQHELVVAAEAAGGHTVHTMVQVRVADVNDNPPYFLNPQPQVTVVEEDDRHLPATIAKVEAVDKDWMDHHGLLYTVRGDGVDGHPHDDAFFSINSLTGELIQLRALDRDPPRGKEVWRVRVQVRDGQALWSRQAMDQLLAAKSKNENEAKKAKSNERRRNNGDKSNKRRSKRENTIEGPVGVRESNRENNYAVEKSIDETLEIREEVELPGHTLISSGTGVASQASGAEVRGGTDLSNESQYLRRYRVPAGSKSRRRSKLASTEQQASGGHQLGTTRDAGNPHMKMKFDSGGTDNLTNIRHTENEYTSGSKVKIPYNEVLGRKNGAAMDKVKDPSSRSTTGTPLSPRSAIKLRQAHAISTDINLHSNEQTLTTLQFYQESNISDYKHKKRGLKSTSQFSYHNSVSHTSRETTEFKSSKTLYFVPIGNETPDIVRSGKDKKNNLLRIQTSALPANGLEPTIKPEADSKLTQAENSAHKFKPAARLGNRITKRTPAASVVPQSTTAPSRGRRSTGEQHYELGSFSTDSGCDDPGSSSSSSSKAEPTGRRLDGSSVQVVAGSRVHVAETVVMVVVKDINDNSPVFPNATMFGEVQENGPIDLSVAVIAAWDADDISEGTNARITYSIAKNVVYEPTGEPIFSVHPATGLIRTAICCLDRETTPEYEIQVVAVDGGGLKGTGVVVVRLVDVNDNCPRLEHSLWDLETDETRGQGPPDNSTLLHLSVLDSDTSNYFFYRVVEASGWGWEHFGVRTVGAEGQLFARQTLDYEDETHRRGFRFMVQVTDKGRGGWRDPRHMDAAWVTVRLRDLNDNPPHFHRLHAHVTVKEDAAPGTLLAALPAHDPDMGGEEGVEYRVEGAWGALSVDSEGGVSLRRALDREAPDGAIGVAKIVGVDHGRPPLTATATLTITVTDVNDSPPVLLPPTLFHVTEGAAPTLLGALTATDHDVWALGHGPPFNFSLAPTNPAHVLAHISLKFDPHLDSGRGGAEVWTVGPVDREEHRQLLVGVVVADAGGVSATHTVTVIVDDINDNPMKPGAKTVYLWKTQGGGSDAPLGRVFVDDPDDWDLGDKTFRWLGSPHPLFSLNTNTGDLFASSQVREARYELQFAVSDQLWGQRDVEANVTVAVRILTPDALAHAAPITLTPTTPAHLARGWTPELGGGGLGRVIQGVLRVVGEAAHTVEVVSVYTHRDRSRPHHPTHSSPYTSPRPHAIHVTTTNWVRPISQASSACVWVSVREQPAESFMDPIKLLGLLALHSHQIEAATNLKVVIESPTTGSGGGADGLQEDPALHHTLHHSGPPDPSSAASRASTTLPLQVIDTNVTSLVTPLLAHTHACHAHDPETCTPTSCLNGGRCVGSPGGKRCVCPEGSWGARCKVLARTFTGDGWAWVRPLPPCFPTTISLRLLTRRPHALVLYSGPLATVPRHPDDPPTPMLALQVWRGRPQLLLEGGAEALKLEVNRTVNDGDWHTIHLHLHAHGTAMMVDLCGDLQGWDNDTRDDSRCLAQESWTDAVDVSAWLGTGPLQIGGLAHTPPSPAHHGWREAPTPRPLDGCVSHLTLNSQLVDLGEPAYSRNTAGGCRPQNKACREAMGGCGHRGQCMGGLNLPECECDPGWTGPACTTPTVPATFGPSSFVKMALSFTPASQMMTAQLRLRTRGSRQGLLLHMASRQHSSAFTLHLRGGVVCATVSGAGWAARAACVEGRPVGDGAWHTVRAEHHGPNLVVSVDDGDFWRRNESLILLREGDEGGGETLTPIDLSEGVSVGGLPERVGVAVVNVLNDLTNSCIDDVRVSGRQLQLPPAVNGSRWGQVTSWQGLEPGCTAPDACLNATCDAPLSCVSTWGTATCSCGPGEQVVGGACEDVDECAWRPCLHGGSCYNLRPGFQCVCGPGHTGDHCQWTEVATAGHPLAAPVAIAALTVSLLLLVVMGVVISVRLRRQWLVRGAGAGRRAVQGSTVVDVKDATRCIQQGDHQHKAFLECLHLRLSHAQATSIGKEERLPQSPSTPYATGVRVSAGVPGAGVVSVSAGVPVGGVLAGRELRGSDSLPAKDDLRAYAYEGDGSSAGSLSSALSGLREEQPDEGSMKQMAPGFLEVMDLLKNLPEASMSPLLLSKGVDQTMNTTEATSVKTRGQNLTHLSTKGAVYSMMSKAAAAADTKTTAKASPQHIPATCEEQTTVC